jgi:hypothetical protein
MVRSMLTASRTPCAAGAARTRGKDQRLRGRSSVRWVEKRIMVFYVTHFFELAHSFHERRIENALFLRAERQTAGGRTFKLVEAQPLKTSHGAVCIGGYSRQMERTPKQVGANRSPELQR